MRSLVLALESLLLAACMAFGVDCLQNGDPAWMYFALAVLVLPYVLYELIVIARSVDG